MNILMAIGSRYCFDIIPLPSMCHDISLLCNDSKVIFSTQRITFTRVLMTGVNFKKLR